MKQVVIVGAGQAGLQAAVSLRDGGFEGRLILVGDEPGFPYQRPPLSKAYLLDKTSEEDLQLKDADYFDACRIELESQQSVLAIERDARRVRLKSGTTLDYDHLILATGVRNRALMIPGAHLDGVISIRTLNDARQLKGLIGGAKRVVVIGAGFIGLEFAAVAAERGLQVVVVEATDRPMARTISVAMSRAFTDRHRAWGVDFAFGVGVSAITGPGRVAHVELTDGRSIEADIVVVGIGVLPNQALAADAGLTVSNGIAVDAHLATADQAISSIGDCALHPSPFSLTGPVRVESVQNAIDQSRHVAGRLLGKNQPYGALPWFWSDQGDLKLQIAGLSAGHDATVIRGDPAIGAFSVFCFVRGRLQAVESVNRPADHVFARRLLAMGAAGPMLTPMQAADPEFDLKRLLKR